ncbi:hypothetical protein [Streptomyces pseudogriseolus]|uniref:hypothetical protein n=1 Tax=Streptomyces pseudogriseolus TaxID=36817 RepID=UPI001CE380E5|nr:hypothetical protein [Streptomyces pseudogriseolus]
MTADRWTRMVRQQVGLGRFLPLGGRHDGAWIAERAAGEVLRRAAERDVPEVRMDGIRIGLADPDAATEPAVPAPQSALPPGPLRLTAEFAATAAWPLPETVSRLRAALAVTATERIGLAVTEVDLRVTDLLDAEPAAERAGAGGTADLAGGTTEPAGVAATAGASVTPGAAQDAGDVAARQPGVLDTSEDGGGSEADRVAGVVLEVPGVSRLTGVWGRPVRLGERAPAAGDALPRRHARVDLAVAAGFRPLEVARAVRAAVAAAGPDRPTVAVLVTDLD